MHFIYGDRANKHIADWNMMNPVMPGAAQDTVLVGHALLCTGTHERSDEDMLRAWELMKFYGWQKQRRRVLHPQALGHEGRPADSLPGRL